MIVSVTLWRIAILSPSICMNPFQHQPAHFIDFIHSKHLEAPNKGPHPSRLKCLDMAKISKDILNSKRENLLLQDTKKKVKLQRMKGSLTLHFNDYICQRVHKYFCIMCLMTSKCLVINNLPQVSQTEGPSFLYESIHPMSSLSVSLLSSAFHIIIVFS